jgi:WD40 repeat protein
MGNMEMVTITAESGVFTAADGYVEVQLLPDTAHHLQVVARVRTLVNPDGCVYGGYSLRTTTDRYGAPLLIVKGEPGPPPRPAAPIGVDNVAWIEELVRLSPEAATVTDFSFRGSDQLLSVGTGSAEPRIDGWSLLTGEPDFQIVSAAAEALVVVASPDGALIATGGPVGDPAVRLWDVDGGAMQELGFHDGYLLSLAFSPSGALLASGSNDDQVHVWAVDDGHLVSTFRGDVPGRSQAFTSLYWPDDHTLIAGASDAVYTWDLDTGQMVRRVPSPDGAPFLVRTAFAAGGQRLAAVAQDDHLYAWEGAWTAWPAPEPGLMLGSVAVSPDEGLVAAETYDGALYIWDAARGTLLATRQPLGPTGGAALHFSPDGRYLVSGGRGAPIRVWGVPVYTNALPLVLSSGP